MPPHPRLFSSAIRREILSVLAASADMSVPSATAHVAANWTARRRLQGESPSAVQTTQAMVCEVGVAILDDLAAGDRETGPTSDYVTWEVCTCCGLLAALGWALAGSRAGAPGTVLPVEFDCPTGCRVRPDELVRAYAIA